MLPDSPSALTREQVTHRASRGAYSVVLRLTAVQGLQVVSAIALARLIAPDDYGSFAVALTVVAAARYIGDLGLTSSFITKRVVSAEVLQTGALIALAVSAAQAIVACGVGPLLAGLLDGSDITAILAALSVTLIVDALRFGPTVRLNRELAFARTNTATVVETLVLYVVQIALLLAGFGLWGLVIAQLARSVVGTMVLAVVGHGFVRPRLRTRAGPLIRAGVAYQAAPMIAGLAGIAAPVAVGLALDIEAVGLWAWATVLAAPLAAVLLGVHNLAFNSFSRLVEADAGAQDRAAELALRLCVLVVAWPAGTLCGLAPEIVPLVFDERWSEAVPAVQLCLVGLLATSVATVCAAVLEARREAWVRVRSLTVASLLGVLTIYPLAKGLGVGGAALASGVVVPVVDAALLTRFSRIRQSRALMTATLGFGLGYLVSSLLADEYVTSLTTLAAAGAAAATIAGALTVLGDREAIGIFFRHSRAKPEVT
jgi:O-antigen/teichoic acid export membrane protein